MSWFQKTPSHRRLPQSALTERRCTSARRRSPRATKQPIGSGAKPAPRWSILSRTRTIAGQGTAALELLEDAGALDALIAPVGGGGLISGSSIAAHSLSPDLPIFAAEPEGAADAYESLRRGERVTDVVPHTICDGLRAGIGPIDFSLMREHRVTVLPVSDDETIAAMRLIWERMKIIVEPSSATVLAAVLRHKAHFAGKRVGLILTGGNVDLDRLPWSAA